MEFDSNYYESMIIYQLYKFQKNNREKMMKKYGLTDFYASFILVIKLAKKELCMADITKILDIDKANTTRGIALLELRGYVVRNKKHDKERKYTISLTEKGEILANDILDCIRKSRDYVLSILSDDEIRELKNIVKKIENNINSIEEQKC